MKSTLKISFAYLAAIIGAGFASGSEIIHYFMKYGNLGIIGVVLASAGFGMFAFLVLDACIRYEAYDFNVLVKNVMPQKLHKYIKIVITIFTFIVLGGMISAFAVLTGELTGLSAATGSIVFSVLCGIVLILPEETVLKRVSELGAFIVIFICILCVYMINNRCVNVFSQKIEMPLSAISYMSYNVASVCPFLCSAAKLPEDRRDCVKTGIISFGMSLAALGLIWCILSVYHGKIQLGDMPMLTVALRQGRVFGIIYASVIAAAIFTSAISSGFGIIRCMDKMNMSYRVKVVLTLILGYALSSVGFTQIVSVLYNIAGIASFVLPLYLFLNFLNKVVFKRIKEIK